MDEQIQQDEKNITLKDKPIIYNKIDVSLYGELLSLSKNKAEVFFVPTETMIYDDESIHPGFVFSAAAYTAMCAINKKNSIIISSETKFLAPIEYGHELVFKANAIQGEAKKCEVKVEGFLLDIKIFDAIFYIAIFDKKLFRLKLKEDKEA
ncbi:thioesterase [Helicobacter sp. 13S00477-4]|uniref:thioesterase n=1 Tax=Helicobacter sp. 13S00477-4 TaxID=1905759 RepID=UPI000BA75DBE|nr:thioesterase [Helicobacter sp. 13S00477-4]PAF52296.1 thioesterase [Helicobacter sp. 13S00477-4]